MAKTKTTEKQHKGSMIRSDLIRLVEQEREKTLPRLSWSQMIERIISDRYNKQK
jgi:hypothetical protein